MNRLMIIELIDEGKFDYILCIIRPKLRYSPTFSISNNLKALFTKLYCYLQ